MQNKKGHKNLKRPKKQTNKTGVQIEDKKKKLTGPKQTVYQISSWDKCHS